MRRVCALILSVIPVFALALGALCHNYIADQAQQMLAVDQPEAAQLLQKYHDVYLAGSDYPDTGFVPGHDFGEIAHWPGFVDPFIAYIRDTYTNPTTDADQTHRDKLIAFVMGISTHDKSDIVSHWNFYQWVAQFDFHGVGREAKIGGKVYAKAHKLMDPGSDAYVTVRKGIYNHPTHWWVPIKDLVRVYKAAGHPEINGDLLVEANAEYYVLTGLDEDLIAYPEYYYNALIAAPWAMKNFESSDVKYGALPEMIRQSAKYADDVWSRIEAPQTTAATITFPKHVSGVADHQYKIAELQLIDHAIHVGWLSVTPTFDDYGDAIFTPESVKFNSALAKQQFNDTLKALINKLLHH